MSSIRATRLAPLARAALAAMCVARSAWAQSAPVSSDAANADSLFSEAKQLMSGGDYLSACPKLAESYRLDPGTGTLTALAVCHQHIGKTATAWNEFGEVASSAQRQGRADREAFARQQIAALEPLLSRLTIQVSAETALIPKLQVRRDGVVIGQPAWSVAVPVDPGDHLIEATAPDREPWSDHVIVEANAGKKEIVVPPLANTVVTSVPVVPPPSPRTATPSEPPSDHRAPSTMRVVGLVAGGAGIVSLAIGSYFGATAISNSGDARKLCPSSPCSNSTGVNENNDAKNDALISDITIVAGVAALGTGVFLFLTSPQQPASPSESTPPTAWRIVPVVALGRAGLALHAIF
jgi:hypothetical protein